MTNDLPPAVPLWQNYKSFIPAKKAREKLDFHMFDAHCIELIKPMMMTVPEPANKLGGFFLSQEKKNDQEIKVLLGNSCPGFADELSRQTANDLLKLWPDAGVIRLAVIRDLLAYHKDSEALEEAKMLIHYRPMLTYGWVRLAALYDKMNDVENTLSTTLEALKLFPNDADLWNFLGLMCRHAGLKEDELTAYRKGAEIDPRALWSYHNILWTLLHEPGDHAKDTFKALEG